MVLSTSTEIVTAELSFGRTPLQRNYVMIDTVSSYIQGVADGDAGGFVRGNACGRNTGADSIEKPAPYDEGMRVGVALGSSGLTAAFARGLAAGDVAGATRGLALGQQRGRDSVDVPAPYEDGFRVGVAHGTALAASTGGGADIVAPTVAVVSPTPGVAPGAPGGFPLAFAVAKVTPIVLQFSDASGVAAAIVTATYRDYPTRGHQVTEVVYNRGQFVSNYIALSSQLVSSGLTTLTCARDSGWPVGTGVAGDIVFGLEVVDTAGNVA